MSIALLGLFLTACNNDSGPPPEQPEVEVRTMEEIGKLPPEQEAQQLRQRDQRPQEDRGEGGI